MVGREPTIDTDFNPVGEELRDVKRFVGRTMSSYLFTSQANGEKELLVKVVPFDVLGSIPEFLDLEGAYEEALALVRIIS